jgi:hypothetical protein
MKRKTTPNRRQQVEFFVGLIFLLCIVAGAAAYACEALLVS